MLLLNKHQCQWENVQLRKDYFIIHYTLRKCTNNKMEFKGEFITPNRTMYFPQKLIIPRYKAPSILGLHKVIHKFLLKKWRALNDVELLKQVAAFPSTHGHSHFTENKRTELRKKKYIYYSVLYNVYYKYV